jgi:integrase
MDGRRLSRRRSEARKVLGAIEGGADPIAQRKAAREVRTFKAVADDFLALHIGTKRKARTGHEYARILSAYVLPAIGSTRIVDVRRADVARTHGKLSAPPCRANRSLAVVSAIWNWAARRDEAAFADNPARQSNPILSPRESALSDERRARPRWRRPARGESIGLPNSVDETKPTAKHEPKARSLGLASSGSS